MVPEFFSRGGGAVAILRESGDEACGTEFFLVVTDEVLYIGKSE